MVVVGMARMGGSRKDEALDDYRKVVFALHRLAYVQVLQVAHLQLV
jgi:hypothetical protein